MPEFTTYAAKFIAQGMDYICNVQIPKKSCDVIYQYQYIMRSELFVSERIEILEQLKPLIKDLKEKKFPMITNYNMLENEEDTEQVQEIINLIDLQQEPSADSLKNIQTYFDEKQNNLVLTDI